MATNIKRLQDRAAAIVSRINDLTNVEDRSEDQTTELEKLTGEADKVKSDIEFENRLFEKEKELRSVMERAAPAASGEAPKKEEPKKVEVRHLMPHHTTLRAYGDGPEAVEQAYRVGRWLKAHVFKSDDDLRWCKDHGVVSRALNEGVNSAGGSLVPDEFADRVIRLVETYGTFPPAVENMTMNRDTMTIPKRLSGSSSYFVGEGSAVTEGEPTYGNVSLVARKLAVACRLSSEIFEDALVNMADLVTTEFATSLALKIDQCGWLGDGGQSTYGGIFGIVPKINNGSYAASLVTAATGGTSFGALTLTDFLNTMGKIPLYARQGAAWYVSPAGYAASMARLKYAAGGNAVAQLAGPAGETFLGYPVRLVHVMNSTLTTDASAVKVLFGNLAQSSIMGRRREFSVKLFDQVYATTDQLLLQGTLRFDINHHSLGDASTVGPVVALKTSAS